MLKNYGLSGENTNEHFRIFSSVGLRQEVCCPNVDVGVDANGRQQRIWLTAPMVYLSSHGIKRLEARLPDTPWGARMMRTAAQYLCGSTRPL